MSPIFRMIMALVLIFLVSSSCATKKYPIPDKYSLDGQLEKVDVVADVRAGRTQAAFTNFNETFEDPRTVIERRDTVTYSEGKNQWIKIDEQSFILRSAPKEYYLIILDRPAIGLLGTDTISFTLSNNVFKAGSDYLQLGNIRHMIERIYKIDSAEKMREIKAQLTKKQDKE